MYLTSINIYIYELNIMISFMNRCSNISNQIVKYSLWEGLRYCSVEFDLKFVAITITIKITKIDLFPQEGFCARNHVKCKYYVQYFMTEMFEHNTLQEEHSLVRKWFYIGWPWSFF